MQRPGTRSSPKASGRASTRTLAASSDGPSSGVTLRRRCAPSGRTSRRPNCPRGSSGSATRRARCRCHSGRARPRPLLRLRPAQQRPHAALRRASGHAATADAGLTTIGVQAPRFPFGADREAVAAGWRGSAIEFPVAIDADRRLWHAYGCEGWPSLFLWKLGGALAWFHFGEGEYRGDRGGDPGRAARTRRAPPACRRRWTPCGQRRPRRQGDAPHPGALPRRLVGAPWTRARTAGAGVGTRRAAPTRRSRARGDLGRARRW